MLVFRFGKDDLTGRSSFFVLLNAINYLLTIVNNRYSQVIESLY